MNTRCTAYIDRASVRSAPTAGTHMCDYNNCDFVLIQIISKGSTMHIHLHS